MMTIEIPPAQFKQLIDRVREDTGIDLPESSHRAVHRFLAERLEMLNVDLPGYLRRVSTDRNEYDRLIDAVTIKETYFFREEKHFRVIDGELLPRILAGGRRRIRLWSVTCATGEEAISLAALAEKHRAAAPRIDITVAASDINALALAAFSRGIYTDNAFRKDGATFHDLLTPHLTRSPHGVRISPALIRTIRTLRLNLHRPGDQLGGLPGSVDIALFRNTLIYMPLSIRRGILGNIVPFLSPGGYLFLASSEMPLISHPELALTEVDGVYFFRKKAAEEKHRGVTPSRQLMAEIEKRRTAERTVAAAMPGAAREPYDVDVGRILTLAGQKLNNSLFSMEGDIHYGLALQLIQVVYLINTGSMAEARDLLEMVSGVMPENALVGYLYGFIDLVDCRPAAARRRFEAALDRDPGFWPARFRLARLQAESDPASALAAFQRCVRDIETCLAEDRYDYALILEGFSPRYFLQMCRQAISRF